MTTDSSRTPAHIEAHYRELKPRVEALGCALFLDDADDGDPRFYIHDPKVGKHVIVNAPADEVEDWCDDRETAIGDAKPNSEGATTDISENASPFASRSEAWDAIDRGLAEIHAVADVFQLASETGGGTFCDGTPETIGSMILQKSSAASKALTWLAGHPEPVIAPRRDETAADRLRQLEAEAMLLPLNEILKYLDGCNFCVSLDLVEGLGSTEVAVHNVGHEDAEYSIAHRRWSETGVRHTWAEQKLIWSLRVAEDGGEGSAE